MDGRDKERVSGNASQLEAVHFVIWCALKSAHLEIFEADQLGKRSNLSLMNVG